MGGVAWTQEEDHLLKKCIELYGEGKWHRIPFLAGLNRCRKSCRLRWLNYLRPNIKRGSFTEEEVDLIIKLHELLGNRWSTIAGRLPGRTANDVKNYWNCHLSKKLNADQLSAGKLEEIIAIDKNHVEAIRPQPGNLISTVRHHTEIEEVLNYETHLPLSQEVNTPTPWIYLEEGQGQGQKKNQIHPAQEDYYSASPCVELEHGMVGDMSMDFHFEDVRVQDNRNISDWDDLILDMDLWNSSL